MGDAACVWGRGSPAPALHWLLEAWGQLQPCTGAPEGGWPGGQAGHPGTEPARIPAHRPRRTLLQDRPWKHWPSHAAGVDVWPHRPGAEHWTVKQPRSGAGGQELRRGLDTGQGHPRTCDGPYRDPGGPGGTDAGSPRRCLPHSGQTRAGGSVPPGPYQPPAPAAAGSLCGGWAVGDGVERRVPQTHPQTSVRLPPLGDSLLALFSKGQLLLLLTGERPRLLPSRSPGGGGRRLVGWAHSPETVGLASEELSSGGTHSLEMPRGTIVCTQHLPQSKEAMSSPARTALSPSTAGPGLVRNQDFCQEGLQAAQTASGSGHLPLLPMLGHVRHSQPTPSHLLTHPPSCHMGPLCPADPGASLTLAQPWHPKSQLSPEPLADSGAVGPPAGRVGAAPPL